MVTTLFASAVRTDARRRCYGFCIEEQLKLQLERRGCSYSKLPWNLTLHRIHHRASADETDETRAARLAIAAAQTAGGQKWREEHGVADGQRQQCATGGADDGPLQNIHEVPPQWG